MFLRSRSISFLLLAFVSFAASVSAQTSRPALPSAPVTEVKKPTPTPTPPPTAAVKGAQAKPVTAEQVAESSIFLYGYPGGRLTLNQIRKTTFERGVSSITNPEGKFERANYQRFIIRGETSEKERIRLDQDFPGARYALIQSDAKVFGMFNNSVFPPSDALSKTFQNLIVHSIDAFLRYQENGSTLALASREKVMGVDYYIVDLTDKQNHKTRYYVSSRSFRVMMLEYEEDGVKFRRRFYDYNYAQSTLVPFRTILWANEKIIEETDIGTITFGQKVDEELFKAS